jgi:hypothetical protein
VKRKRRVEIRIERREVSVFGAPGFISAQPPGTSRPESSGLLCVRPAACPACGSPELLLLAEAVTLAGLDVASLQTGIEAGRFHLHCSVSGEWWICRQSTRTVSGEVQ